MDQLEEDQRTLATLVERWNKSRFPRATEIKQRLEAGETLTSHDIEFLHTVLEDGGSILQVVERNPEYQEIAAKVIAFYGKITQLAVDNELHPGTKPD